MNFNYKVFLLLCLVLTSFFTGAQTPRKGQSVPMRRQQQLMFSDDFEQKLDTAVWIVEMEPKPSSSVTVEDGKLVLNTRGGVTVWLNKRLTGDIRIEYTRKVIMNNGPNDRVSDLNNFWMATDPKHDDLFTRQGKFEEYDSLNMYYTGMGGNTNSTTRFRKYQGGDRKLLQEYLDSTHLLKPDKEYHIAIVVSGNTTRFFVDGECYFAYNDPEILKEGYFGLRSTYSHQVIDDIKVYQLK